MADINAVYVGAVSPVATRYDLETANPAFDLTTATGGRLQVLYGDGTVQLWECTLGPTPPEVAITATKLRLTLLADYTPSGGNCARRDQQHFSPVGALQLADLVYQVGHQVLVQTVGCAVG